MPVFLQFMLGEDVLVAPAAILVRGANIIAAESILQCGSSGDADGLGIYPGSQLVQGKAVGTWHGLPS